MIVLHDRRFQISEYHQRLLPEAANRENVKGLVTRLEVRFEDWLPDLWLPADAFIDTGSDSTLFSLRWLDEIAEEHNASSGSLPGHFHFHVLGRVSVRVGGAELEVPTIPQVSPWIRWQGEAPPEGRFERYLQRSPYFLKMPGFEDVIIGRDCLVHWGALLVVDGENRKFSLLYPDDQDNQRRRKAIYRALDPDEPVPPPR